LEEKRINKRKIINDPVHGFVTIPFDFIFDLIEHPYFQRLRRIKQLGLTHYVYPGATHTRFQHTIGALHLMNLALESLKSKGVIIEKEEEEAILAAILLHDIGHGPFSHALEESLIEGVNHEYMSQLLMKELNKQFGKKLDLAIAIFNNQHTKKFLHQLVSSQLDMDRLDYIKRDSFCTGVTEGTIGTDRIIKMLNVVNDQLVVEKKGIYSVEKFLIARRLMYWQVYFHKTVVASENLLVKILQRAKSLAKKGEKIYATPALEYFLYNDINSTNLDSFLPQVLEQFISLDDSDILVSAKEWIHSEDRVLSILSQNTIERKLPKIWISEQPQGKEIVTGIMNKIQGLFNFNRSEAEYFLYEGIISNSAFSGKEDMIQIMMNNSETKDISEVSDILNIPYLQKSETKYFICYPKECAV
jgi:uncharacterized protein